MKRNTYWYFYDWIYGDFFWIGPSHINRGVVLSQQRKKIIWNLLVSHRSRRFSKIKYQNGLGSSKAGLRSVLNVAYASLNSKRCGALQTSHGWYFPCVYSNLHNFKFDPLCLHMIFFLVFSNLHRYIKWKLHL